MRTLSEIYQANRAQSIPLEQALAQAQQQVEIALPKSKITLILIDII
jgi:hypothetical protein